MWPVCHLIVIMHLVVSYSIQTESELYEGRILTNTNNNRQPHRMSSGTIKEQSTFFPSSSCSQAACPIDDTYPTEFVTAFVSQHATQIDELYSQLYRHAADELILLENTTESYRLKGNFACESDVGWLKLGWARDVTARYLIVINTARYPQIHRLETCRYAEKRCEYLPPCYKSTCKQRFANTHLIVIDPNKTSAGPFIELFPLPSSCSCFIENFIYF